MKWVKRKLTTGVRSEFRAWPLQHVWLPEYVLRTHGQNVTKVWPRKQLLNISHIVKEQKTQKQHTVLFGRGAKGQNRPFVLLKRNVTEATISHFGLMVSKVTTCKTVVGIFTILIVDISKELSVCTMHALSFQSEKNCGKCWPAVRWGADVPLLITFIEY